MLPKMRYRLGLDLGTTSIGWCMIRLDKNEKPSAVIKMGVRIFSDGRNPKDGQSLAVTRRQARQMRRRRDRLLKRKQRLLDNLVSFGFFPAEKEKQRALSSLDPYILRKKGLYGALTPEEFGRALFHINQRRGFLSNRKTDKKDNESGALKKAIRVLREKLDEEDCKTLGEWLANRHDRNESVRARLRGKTQKDKAYDFYADRAMVEHEFETLWDIQSKFNPDIFTDEAHDTLRETLLFQRNLKPVKPGRCTLIPEQERAPLAIPSVQRFRIYQELNNLRILDSNLKGVPVSTEERNKLAQYLETRDITFTQICKQLNLPGSTNFNLQDGKRDKIKGNATSKILSKKELFDKSWHDFEEKLQDEIVKQLLNESNEAKLVNWLTAQTGVDEETAERIANINLAEGYGNLSSAAIDRVLPELQKAVIVYSDAIVKAGFDSHSILSHAEQTGEVMDFLPYYGIPLQRHVAFEQDNPRNDEERYGKIANPTVHIGLNELRKVVNALIRKYGHPSEVIVEVARDLKLSRERKNEIQRDQKKRQDRNQVFVEQACEILDLNPDNLNKNKRRELSQKMQLWTELNRDDVAARCCPYTGEHISIEKLLSNEVEIEHILPFSITLDDSLNNKTISLVRANRIKGNRTPYEAFGENDEPGYHYEQILLRASHMPKAKQLRFAPDGHQQWLRDNKGFLARALNDTAYLSRIAREYLCCICPPNKVRTIPGHLTAMLRGKYGLNRLISENDSKNRNDHRHHAIDAGVIAITDQGLLQRFAKESAKTRERNLQRLVDDMPLPWPTYREHVERAVKQIHVSHRPDHGYQGALHKESAWKPLSDGKAARHVINETTGHREKQIANKNLVTITSTNNKRHGFNSDGNPKAYKGYVGGNNYCIEIYADEKGKWRGNVVTRFEAYQMIRKYGEDEGFRQLRNPRTTQSGHPLVMRLMINDCVTLHHKGRNMNLRVVKMKASTGEVTFSPIYEANVDARNRDKSDAFKYITKLPGSLQKAKAHFLTVSAIGEINKNRMRK